MSSNQERITDSCTSVTSDKSVIQSSCRICLSKIFDPASLTCGHKFCEKCLCEYWYDRDRPDFILCPLCRANNSRVTFTKTKKAHSTQDFRNTFNDVKKLSTEQPENNESLLCINLSILTPLLFCAIEWLRTLIWELFTI